MNTNPYAPPADEGPGRQGPTDDDGFIEGGRGVEAGRGYQWIADGWGIVKGGVGMWILVGILYGLLAVVVSIIPVAGRFLLALIAPILSGGLMMGCRDVRDGRAFGVSHLFAGFSKAGGLVVIGLVHAIWTGVLAGAGFAMGVSAAFQIRPEPLHPGDLLPLMLFSLGSMVAGIPLTMATYYATPLVALRDMSPTAAMKNSFLGASKNILPFIVYSLCSFLFAIAAVIPCGLGLLVLVPVLFASLYTGYRDVFFADPPPAY